MEDIGGTWPTPEREATAHRLRTLHTVEDDCCWWCGKHWPCPDERWANRVLRRALAVSRR